MGRARSTRDASRRTNDGGAAAGVSSLAFNGNTPQTGAINLRSPMFADPLGPNTRIDNGNVKTLSSAASIVGVDVDLNQSFFVDLDDNATMTIPTVSILAAPRPGEKITFTIQNKSETNRTIAWTGGAGGYLFADVGSVGVTLARFNALLLLIDSDKVMKIGYEFFDDGDLDAKWLAVALAGPFTLP